MLEYSWGTIDIDCSREQLEDTTAANEPVYRMRVISFDLIYVSEFTKKELLRFAGSSTEQEMKQVNPERFTGQFSEISGKLCETIIKHREDIYVAQQLVDKILFGR